jgi:hypothetical protein
MQLSDINVLLNTGTQLYRILLALEQPKVKTELLLCTLWGHSDRGGVSYIHSESQHKMGEECSVSHQYHLTPGERACGTH